MITKRLGLPELPLGQLQPRQQHLLIAVAVILATLVIAHQFILQPIDRQRVLLQQDLAIARQQTDLVQSLATVTKSLDEAREPLRAKTSISALFQEINTMAVRHDISVNTVVPQPAQTVGRYARLPIRVEAVGSFEHVVQFVRDLEESPAHLHIDGVELMAQDRGTDIRSAEETAALQIQARLTVSVLLSES